MPAERAPERQTMIEPYEIPPPPDERPAPVYKSGDRVPAGYHVEESYNTALLASGGALLAFNYALSVIAARAELSFVESTEENAPSPRNMSPLYVPLIGPWTALFGSGWAGSERVLLAFDGLGQVAGFGLMMAGLLVRERYLVFGPGRVAMAF
jgi:hypothetical protein